MVQRGLIDDIGFICNHLSVERILLALLR
jgi:hypothetical protein